MATTDPRVDTYIANAAEFARPILEHLRAVVHAGCPDATETLKWGMPYFLHAGRNLAHMAAFKAHCAFGFWHGDAVVATGKNQAAMGQFGRITSVKDLPPKRDLVRCVQKAVELIDSGAAAVRVTKAESRAAADRRTVDRATRKTARDGPRWPRKGEPADRVLSPGTAYAHGRLLRTCST